MTTQCTNIVLPTPLDYINAIMYTLDRIKKEKCQDPTITKKYPGIKWQSHEENRIYHCPVELKDKCDHGNCVISTKDQCMAQSQVPYLPDGKPIPSIPCIDTKTGLASDEICKNIFKEKDPENSYICGESSKKCIPAKSYLEWREGQNGKDGKCIFGNFSLKQWCENPEQRRAESAPGATDVPAFKYNNATGDCTITKEYCDWMGVSYDENDKGRPNCYISTGQTIGEMIMGKTIFRGIKKSVEGFDTLPYQINKLADRKLSSKYVLLAKDFGGPGIKLYQIIWKPEAIDKHPTGNISIAGFFSDEVEKVYPELIKTKSGAKYIIVNRDQVKENPKIKRIYFVAGSGGWLLQNIMAMLKNKS